MVVRRKRGCHSGASPRLVACFSLDNNLGCHGASPSLGSFHSLFLHPSRSHPKLENFNHTKLNKTFVRSISIRIINHYYKYYTKQIHILCLHYINFIPTFLWQKLIKENHRAIKISRQHKENRIFQNRAICSNLTILNAYVTPKILKIRTT